MSVILPNGPFAEVRETRLWGARLSITWRLSQRGAGLARTIPPGIKTNQSPRLTKRRVSTKVTKEHEKGKQGRFFLDVDRLHPLFRAFSCLSWTLFLGGVI